MPKETFQQVLDKVDERRSAAKKKDLNLANEGGSLHKYAKVLGDASQDLVGAEGGDNQKTMAIGIFFYERTKALPVYCGEIDEKAVKDIVYEVLSSCGGGMNQKIATAPEGTSNASGLHAEMAILRYMAQRAGGKQHLYGKVVIACIGKRVCIDCAGYMNSHQIAHISVIPSEQGGCTCYECGGPSRMGGGMWENPFSGSTYQGGKDVHTYQNIKRRYSLGLYSK